MRDAKREKIEEIAKEKGVSFDEARTMLREGRWAKAKSILTSVLPFVPVVGNAAAKTIEAGDAIVQKAKEAGKS